MLSSAISYIKNRQLLPILVAFCASIIILVLPSTFKIAASRFFINTVYYPFAQLDIFLTDISQAKRKNIALNQRLIQVSIQAAQVTEDHYENTRLRQMLSFDLQIPYSLVPAEVIGLNSGPLIRSIMINAGTAKSIDVNMPVVIADGIVGKTVSLTNNTAVVQLLFDHNCKVSAVDQSTRAMGIVRWQGGKLLEMGDVPVESQIVVGDTVVSSGLGGIFPPGLIVGTVVYTKNLEGTLFKHVMIRPTVDFGSLEEVFVVIYGE
jgi:rod shape-determining protein MreC